jgi:two-component sensor histidine kinase
LTISISIGETLTEEDIQLLEAIKAQMNLVADISRADVLLYGPLVDGRTTVLKHAHSNSIAPVYLKNYYGIVVNAHDMPVVIKALRSQNRQRGSQGIFGDGARVSSEVWPIYHPFNAARVIGALSIDTSLLEQERLRRRNKVFQKALRQLQSMLVKGLLTNAETLSPFREHEGLVVVGSDGHIQYASGIAINLYRRLGIDGLEGRHLENLQTQDDRLVRKAMSTLTCVEEDAQDGDRNWVRTALPLLSNPTLKANLRSLFRRSNLPEELAGVLLVIRDITEERRQEQEIRVKNAMIKEIHHRVKNNLQTIAALLRIQSRRLPDKAAQSALKDATNRVLSVAVIHEFLSDTEAWTINIKEVSQRIITQLQHGIIDPEIQVTFSLEGPSIWLPARQATACALVINELLQNSVEHGFEYQTRGNIVVTLIDEGDHVIITINDDGRGLPADFDPNLPSSLGLQIARTLVTEDLQGKLDLLDGENGGVIAKISFPKAVFGAEETDFE